MGTDLLNALCALVALFLPLCFAWFVLSRTARRHPHHHNHGDEEQTAAAHKDRPDH